MRLHIKDAPAAICQARSSKILDQEVSVHVSNSSNDQWSVKWITEITALERKCANTIGTGLILTIREIAKRCIEGYKESAWRSEDQERVRLLKASRSTLTKIRYQKWMKSIRALLLQWKMPWRTRSWMQTLTSKSVIAHRVAAHLEKTLFSARN